MEQPKPTNTYAIISLVASIMGFTGFALVGPLTGIIFGQMAKKQIAETGEDGLDLAKAGVILGIIQLVILALILLGFIILFIVLAVFSAN